MPLSAEKILAQPCIVAVQFCSSSDLMFCSSSDLASYLEFWLQSKLGVLLSSMPSSHPCFVKSNSHVVVHYCCWLFVSNNLNQWYALMAGAATTALGEPIGALAVGVFLQQLWMFMHQDYSLMIYLNSSV
ncbi:hypothetical protein U1Q18_017588 [Sarracenia purpurea var. burkii]